MDSTREKLPKLVLEFKSAGDRQRFLDLSIQGLADPAQPITHSPAWRCVQRWHLGEGDSEPWRQSESDKLDEAVDRWLDDELERHAYAGSDPEVDHAEGQQ